MNTALTIAGSDSSGGAGIQADLKTMTMNGVFATSAITALTAQNTTGVTGILNVTPEFLKQQIEAVFDDIRPDAVKIGMVSSSELINTIADCLKAYNAVNIVVDPVMVATSGARLIAEEAIETLKSRLLPISTVITPNIPEAEILAEMTIETEADMEAAAAKISSMYGCSVLLKGGHNINDANDLLYSNGNIDWFKGKRINNPNTHGTGCTLSSAIASNLAKGYDLRTSIKRAKDYISGALAAMLDLGKGSGPMNHAFDLCGEFAKYAKPDKAEAIINAAQTEAPLWTDIKARSWDACGPDSTTYRLLKATEDIWAGYHKHPFVCGIADGSLDQEKFKFYMIQDYLYLLDYAKVFSIGVAKSDNRELMLNFATSVHNILDGEMDIHRGYMARLGISREEAEATPLSLDNRSYTSYMLRVAYDDSQAEVAAAILSCALSYEAIAREIVENDPKAAEHPFYGEWVRGYAADGYKAANDEIIRLVEAVTKDYTEAQMKHLEEIFVACSRYEADFWEMAWEMKA